MRRRYAALIALLSTVAFLHAQGFYQTVDAQRVQTWIQGAGAWGGVIFLAAYACLQPLGVRSIFFLLGAPLVWSPIQAAFLSWLGAIIASALAFGFSRLVAREWAQERVPARLRNLDERLAQRGFSTVLMLRLVFYTTPAVQLALGVSSVRLRPFVLGTAVGVLPFTLLMTFVGVEVSELLWKLAT